MTTNADPFTGPALAEARVLRHTIPVDDAWHDVSLPGDILYIAARWADAVEIWTLAVVDGDPEAVRTFRVYGTGQPITDPVRHIGTAITAGGQLVWHLFERVS